MTSRAYPPVRLNQTAVWLPAINASFAALDITRSSPLNCRKTDLLNPRWIRVTLQAVNYASLQADHDFPPGRLPASNPIRNSENC